ncbi:polysaccharide deacetylase family protein [Paraglaciecola sp.]|uniref:polysaccharide deacetylase family protein n=1 Tax=Paraglaciecola sp. TaxID=1920173 RepID=UPI003EF471F6
MLSLGLKLLAEISKWRLGEYPLAVIYFHRVLNQPDPFLPDDPTIEEFERLIATLSKHFSTYTISKALELQAIGELPKLSLCISFDDGYADNFTNALPILKKYKVPATFFVATNGTRLGYLWNDILLDSIRHTQNPVLTVAGQTKHLNTIENKVNTYLKLVSQLKFMQNQERDEIISAIVKQLGTIGTPRCMMTEEQVRNLHDDGHEIGGHTTTHSILGVQNNEVALTEIQTNRDDLEEILATKIKTFAFPNGNYPRDFDQRHIDMVKECGFQFACSTNDGGVTSKSNLYSVSRFMPHRKERNQFCLSLEKIAGECE